MKRTVLMVCMLVSTGPVAAQAQAQTSPAEGWSVPRTADGKPNLQGFWTTQTYTPLQRPEHFEGREFLTDEEMAELTALVTAEGVDPLGPNPLGAADEAERRERTQQNDPTHYNNAQWLTTTRPKALTTNRTSLIVDPPDGRIPPMTAEGRERADARRAARGFDGYENRPYQERCLAWTHEGPPMIPPPYNDLYQIFQTPGYVVLFPELSNNPVRVIPTDERPHISPAIRQWPGHSTGQWEGDTLVVDTTNFTPKTVFQGSSESMHVIERFTRVADDTIRYEFTIEDPTTWEVPWSAEIPMVKDEGPLFEYTCHEGNYGMQNTLRGARRADREGR